MSDGERKRELLGQEGQLPLGDADRDAMVQEAAESVFPKRSVADGEQVRLVADGAARVVTDDDAQPQRDRLDAEAVPPIGVPGLDALNAVGDDDLIAGADDVWIGASLAKVRVVGVVVRSFCHRRWYICAMLDRYSP